MKNKAFILIFAVCIVALAFCLFSLHGNKAEIKQLKSVLQNKTESVTYYRDKFNTEHARRVAVEGNISTLKHYYGNLIDSVTGRTGVKSKHITSISTTGIYSQNEVILKVDTFYKNDSSKNYNFSYSDEWINLKGSLDAGNKLQYKTFDSLILTTFTKRKGFLGLGKKETYIDGYSLNPHSHISGIQHLQVIKERRKPFGVGILAGYGWNGAQWSPFVGIGVSYNILKF